MTFRQSVTGTRLLYAARAWILGGTIFTALGLGRPSAAQSVYVVNPRPSETISSVTTVDLSQVGGFVEGNYLINGAYHNADKVTVQITGPGMFTPVSDVAVLKNGVWEYNWRFKPGLAGTFHIAVTPTLHGSGTASQTIDVNVVSSLPGISLGIVPSSVISGLYTGSGNVAGGKQVLGLRVRYASDVAPAKIRLMDGFTPARSAPTFFDLNGAKFLNNDDPGQNKFDPTTPSNTLPFSFTLGTAGAGLIEGLTTITVDDALVTPPTTVYQRSIIVDYRPPVISGGGSITAGNNLSYPKAHTIRFQGIANDPDNGSGSNAAPGGIAGVELVVQSPDDTAHGIGPLVARFPAHLSFGPEAKSDVKWSVDVDTTSLGTGPYQVYAIITDHAGNQTYDTLATNGNMPGSAGFTFTPFTINVNQIDAPAVSVIAPGSLYLKGTQTIQFTATANAEVGTSSNLAYELHSLNDTLDTILKADSGHGDTMSPLSVSWDTTKAADGVHHLALKATDNQQNSATSTQVDVTVDNTAPVVSITAPSPMNLVKGTVTVKATVTDKNIDTVTIADENGNLTTSNTGDNYSADYNTTTATEGTHTITVTAKDKAGNVGAASVKVIVDNKKPVVTITASPFVGKGVFPITGTVSDTNTDTGNVVSYTVSDGSTDLYTGQGSAPFPFNFSVPFDTSAASVAEGDHTLKVVATDKAGNKSDPATVTVKVIKTAPTAAFTTAKNGTITYTLTGGAVKEVVSGTVTFSGTYTSTYVADGAVKVFADGKPLTTSSSAGVFSAAFDTMLVSGGTHTLTVTATDKAGNTVDPAVAATTVTVVSDNTSPVLEVISPANGAVNVPVNSLVSGIVSDLHPGNTVDFYFSRPGVWPAGAPAGSVPITGATNLSLYRHIVVTLPSGSVGATTLYTTRFPAFYEDGTTRITPGTPIEIRVVASDTASPANTGVSAPTLVTAASNQSITIDRFEEFDGKAPNGNNSASAPLYYLHSVQFQPNGIDQGNLIPVRKNLPIDIIGTVNVPSLQSYTINVVDGSGVVVYTDTEGSAANPLMQPITTNTKLNLSTPFDTTGIPDGIYSVQISATDTGGTLFPLGPGNTALPIKISVVIDNTAPKPTITSPLEGVFLKGDSLSSVTGTILDEAFGQTAQNPTPNILEWMLFDGGTLLNTASGPPTGTASPFASGLLSISGAWKLTTIPEGKHTLSISAVDEARNEGSRSLTVTVDRTPPTATFVTPTPMSYVSGAKTLYFLDPTTITTVPVGVKPSQHIPLQSFTAPVDLTATISDNIVDPNNVGKFTVFNRLKGATSSTVVPGFQGLDVTFGSAPQKLGPKFDWNTFTEGLNTLQLQSTDKAGNTSPITSASSVDVVVVNHAPSASFTNPVRANQVVGSVFTITANITSEAGGLPVPTTWALYIKDKSAPSNQASYFNLAAGTGNNVQYALDTTLYDNGSSKTLLLQVVDKAGNENNFMADIIVDNTPTKVSFTLGAAQIASPWFDVLGNLRTDILEAKQNAKEIAYVGGPTTQAFTLVSTLTQNYVQASLTDAISKDDPQLTVTNTVFKDVNASTAQEINTISAKGANQGLNVFILNAVNAANVPAIPAIMQVVVDNTAPDISISLPVTSDPKQTIPFIVAPGALLTLQFSVNNTTKFTNHFNEQSIAPIKRLSGKNAPVSSVKIFDVTGLSNRAQGGKAVLNPDASDGAWSLVDALNATATNQGLKKANGLASSTGDPFQKAGFTVNWQFLMTSNVFALGHVYRIEVGGAQDVVGNVADFKATYFQVNVN